MNNQKEKQDFSSNIIVLCVLVLLQTITLIFSVVAMPYFMPSGVLGLNLPEWLPTAWRLRLNDYWLMSGVVSGLTAVFALITVVVGLVHRRRLARRLKAEAEQNPLSTIMGIDESDVALRSRRNRPHLVVVESIGVSLFALVATLITLYGRSLELDEATLSGLYFATAALIIWLTLETIQLYYLLPRKPRTGTIIWGLCGIALRTIGGLVGWIYIGLSLSMSHLVPLVWVSGGLLLLGMACQIMHLYFDRKPSDDEIQRRDKLTHISHITPPIEKLLNRQEITTFATLGAQDTANLDEILAEAQKIFAAVTATWPYQAILTHQKSQRLKPLQEKLAEWNGRIDDLKRLEGINAQIEQQLWEEGFFSYEQLAQSDIQQLNGLNPPLQQPIQRPHQGPHQVVLQWPQELVRLWPRQAQLLKFEETLIGLSSQLPKEETQVTPTGWVTTQKEAITQRLRLVRAGLDFLFREGSIASFTPLAQSLTAVVENQLHANGILSYQQLVDIPLAQLQMLLSDAGLQQTPAELKRWQARAKTALIHGVEQLNQHLSPIVSDPFESLEGIDRAIKEQLNAKYHRFEELASLTGYELVELRETVRQVPNHPDDSVLVTWPYQAALVANGPEGALLQFQAGLHESAAQDAIYKAGLLALDQVATETEKLEAIANALAPYEQDVSKVLQLFKAELAQPTVTEPAEASTMQDAETGSEVNDLAKLGQTATEQKPQQAVFDQIVGLNGAVEGWLRRQGVDTLAELAATSTDKLQQILTDSAPSLTYRLLDLLTWPRQAELLENGRLEELEAFQLELLLGHGADDLTHIEGIGPAIRLLLYRHGILSFVQLAAAAAVDLRQILIAGGERFRIANYPETWPEQAALARDGRWNELAALQEVLKAGRREADDDLTLIEGIGPKIQELLQQAGIRTFSQLARSVPTALGQILDRAGERFRLANTPETWPRQAKLARDGRWGELIKLQGQLKGGR
ncbi:MAG: helix-hairpin-helix domain-containing protein [Chloroflexota bacterium]